MSSSSNSITLQIGTVIICPSEQNTSDVLSALAPHARRLQTRNVVLTWPMRATVTKSGSARSLELMPVR